MKYGMHLSLVTGLVGGLFAAVLMSAEVESQGEKGFIPFVIKSSRIAEPRSVYVERRNDRLLVTGMIKKRFRNGIKEMGHVDLEFLDADGGVIGTKKVDILPIRWRRNQRWQRFSSIVGDIPKEFSSLRVRHAPTRRDEHNVC